ncbi:MAG TPA: N-acylglucosamine 2-epimerase, partial [Ohtaekwangia sp.]|nr:N-acylglucosamine 2-epimerase [Ohtaekwangia sp.]
MPLHPMHTMIVAATLLMSCQSPPADERLQLADKIEKSVRTEMLNVWYPKVKDDTYGGFLSTFTYDFKPEGAQDKMIVTQA